MKKIPDDSVCFVVGLKKVNKCEASPLDELEHRGPHPEIRNFGVHIGVYNWYKKG